MAMKEHSYWVSYAFSGPRGPGFGAMEVRLGAPLTPSALPHVIQTIQRASGLASVTPLAISKFETIP
jgi:hypothetical protein